jgi:hypothetical protein
VNALLEEGNHGRTMDAIKRSKNTGWWCQHGGVREDGKHLDDKHFYNTEVIDKSVLSQNKKVERNIPFFALFSPDWIWRKEKRLECKDGCVFPPKLHQTTKRLFVQ